MAAPEFDAELHIETTTIMFADVVESVRLIEQDELANVARIRSLLKRLVTEVVPMFQGTLLERRGDGLLIKFPSGARAVRALRSCIPSLSLKALEFLTKCRFGFASAFMAVKCLPMLSRYLDVGSISLRGSRRWPCPAIPCVAAACGIN